MARESGVFLVVAIVFVVQLVHLPLLFAWFPLTHEYMGCAHTPVSPLPAPLPSFCAGAASPDALKLVSGSLHSFEFACLLASVALSPNPNSTHSSASLGAFALGFGTHLVHDAIGHHANGFLTPEHDHPLEFATDAFVFHGMGFRVLEHFPRDCAVPVASVAASYTNTSQQIVVDAIEKFNAGLDALALLLVPYDREVYQPEMRDWSVCGTQAAWETVLSEWQTSLAWVEKSVMLWMDAARSVCATSKGAEEAVRNGTAIAALVDKTVQDLFHAHNGTVCPA
eukprot:ANDGO_05899.mRNA.1 hypothetical protein